MITTHRKFIERTNSAVRIDRQSGTIYGVKLLGAKSRNGRRYTERAMRDAVKLYDGKKVFLNHPRKQDLSEDRPFESWVGVLHRPRYESGGIYGDIELRTKSPYYEEVLEAAEKFSYCFGCSHVAEGKSTLDGETEVVESINEVFSVDLVTSPATATGLFESVSDPDLTELTTALKKLLVAAPENQNLANACHAFLAEVSSMLAVEQAAIELSHTEAGDDGDMENEFSKLDAEPTRESYFFNPRQPPAPQELKRFADQLR